MKSCTKTNDVLLDQYYTRQPVAQKLYGVFQKFLGLYTCFDLTPIFHPAATRGRGVLSRISAGEATGGVNPARCFSSSAANAAGVA